jgi:hypothetical protein
MPKIMVYSFTRPEGFWQGGVGHRPYKATREVIEGLTDATIIESSAEEIEQEQLDLSGYYKTRQVAHSGFE